MMKKKKKEVCDRVLRVTQPNKLLVVRILDEKTNVWEDGKALSLTVPINHLFLKRNVYIQNNALSVQLDMLVTISAVEF